MHSYSSTWRNSMQPHSIYRCLILTSPSRAVLEQNRLTVELLPPACNLNACLGLTGTITCIASALQARDPAALAKCLTTGLQGVCTCLICLSCEIVEVFAQDSY
jgi:hypothetical protein